MWICLTSLQATQMKLLVSIDSEYAKNLVATFGGGSSATGATGDPFNVQVDAMAIIDSFTNKGAAGNGSTTNPADVNAAYPDQF